MKTIFLLLTALLLIGCGTARQATVSEMSKPTTEYVYTYKYAPKENQFTKQVKEANAAFDATYGITVEIKDGHFRETDKPEL